MPKRKRAIRRNSRRTSKNSRVVKRYRKSPVGPYGYRTPVGKFEKKVYDVDATTIQVNTTGDVRLLCVPVLGTDFTQRIGRRIRIRSVYIRGFICPESAQTAITTGGNETLAQQGRMILVLDRQPNATVMTIAQLLKQAFSFSQLNLDNRDRFKVIADKTFQFQNSTKAAQASPTLIGTYGSNYRIKLFKKLNIPVQFNSTNGGTIADISSNALYMVWIGSQAAGTTDLNASLTTRVRFDDD